MLTPEQEAEVARLVREELTRLLAPKRDDQSLRARLDRAQERERTVLRRL